MELIAPETDHELLSRYAAGRDAEAFTQLAQRYAGMVYATSLRITGDTHDAQDVAQECFLTLARQAGRVRQSLPGWLHVLARSRSLNVLRDRATRRRNEQEAAAVREAAGEGASGLDWAQLSPLVDEAVAALPEEMRELVIQRYLLARPQQEVARMMGISQATVSRRLEQAVALLREKLDKMGATFSVAGLGELLQRHAVTVAPEGLMGELGRMAVAGVGRGSVGWTPIVLGSVGAVIMLLVGVGVYLSDGRARPAAAPIALMDRGNTMTFAEHQASRFSRVFDTPRLTIRRFTPEDWPAFRDLAMDKESAPTAKFDSTWPTDEQGAKNAVRYMAGNGDFWGVYLKSTGQLVGFVAYNGVSDGGELDLGHVFHTQFADGDLDTEALGVMVGHAFDVLPISAIVANNAPEWKSQFVPLRKLGMENDPGEPTGVRMRITREQWMGGAARVATTQDVR